MDTRIKAIEFLEKEHEYWFTDSNGKHRQLHGVTGAIGKLMGKKFPDTDTVKLATLYGHDVHSDSENWIKDGIEPSTEAGKWLVNYLKELKKMCNITAYEAELLVSDFEATASCIDIVAHRKDGKAILFDIKTTTTFDRAYCSLQLSVYKRLFEEVYGEEVADLYVLGTKSKRAFHILEQDKSKVQKVLDMNKA